MEKKEYILELLNIDHFFGEHSGRTTPAIIFISLALAPLLVYVYFSLWFILPIKLLIPVWIIYTVRVFLITIGNEKERLDNFVKRLKDIYSSIVDLINLRSISDNGMITYLSGRISYVIVAYNGTNIDALQHAKMVRRFLESACGKHDVDVYIQNVNNVDNLNSKYDNIKIVTNVEAARDFIEIIDYNRGIITENSTLQKMVIVVKGYKSDWKTIDASITNTINSNASKAFKTVYKVTTKTEIQEILSRDVNGVVNIVEMLRKKFCTGEYYGSKVLEYSDATRNRTKAQVKNSSNIPEPKIIKNTDTASNNFHTIYTRR